MAAQLKQFLDTTGGLWAQGKLANKVVAGFTSASNDHGGQESTLLALYNSFYHWGSFIVPPGYTADAVFAAGGNPYGVSVTAQQEQGVPEPSLAAARHLAQRIVWTAEVIACGNAGVAEELSLRGL